MANSLITPEVLTQPIANNGDKNSIPVTNDQSLGLMSQSTGFPAITSERIAEGGKAPRRADFNGAFNLLSQQHFFLQNGGAYTFRQDVSNAIGGYPLNAMLFYTDSNGNTKIVRSMMQNNTFNFVSTPSYIDDGVHWETVIPTKDWVSETFVNLTGSQTISGNKNFTGALTWNGNSVVSTAGAQTISGDKTFNNQVRFKGARPQYIHSAFIDLTVTPTTNQSTFTDYLDINGNRIGVIGVRKLTSGASGAYLQVGNEGSMAIEKSANGTIYTYAPASDVNNSIVTTVNKSKSANGYYKLGNGLIVQWGTIDNGSEVTDFARDITFPTAFTGNYSLSVSPARNTGNAAYRDATATIYKFSNTGFSCGLLAQGSSTFRYIKWLAIGY